ncbi:hydrolase [Desulfotomaculum sp. 1211_IL3151]|uniref:hydrolase n=1 Tax=Desulfotomaculum sp. 1211_IL3151 TaxID=3084055 RepID=UPI002FDA18B9
MEKYFTNKQDAVLLVIDIQDKLMPVMKYGEQVINNTNTLITIAKDLAIPIMVAEMYPKGLGHTVPEVKGLEDVPIFEKITFSAYTHELSAALKQLGRKSILVTGMETHVCVYQTVRDLLFARYNVFLVADGVCSRTKENYRSGLSLMAAMGAVITNTETVFFDLMKEAGTPQFRKLSKLIK